jgi:hypothetical protein
VTDPNLPDQPGTPPPPPPPASPSGYGAPNAAPAYGQPAPGYGQPSGAKTNVLAIVSLIASISGFVILPFVGPIVGVICGHISLGQIKKTGEQGRGMALAGVILGYVGIALAILGTIIFFVVFGAVMANVDWTTTY